MRDKEKQREAWRRHRIKNREKINAKLRVYMIGYRKKNKKRLTIQKREGRHQLRFDIISHYSKGTFRCFCCGETIYEFLTIDHIDGKGSEHRKRITNGKGSGGRSHTVYRWLKKNNYPKGYQISCFNCNSGRSLNGGVCPHKLKKVKRKV